MAVAVAAVLPRAAAADPAAGLLPLLPAGVRHCVAQPVPAPAAWRRESRYVAASDGTRLALDLYLPEGSATAARRPTVFMATRYWRAREGDPLPAEFARWMDAGFAIAIADVRGTGASFGRWYAEYTRQEARDVGDLVRWVAAQPWSDGRVVATGNSYPGTTALMSPAFGAPAVRLALPRFSDWDLYEDLAFPGGLKVWPLIVAWGQKVRELDLGTPQDGRGVRPVDGPDGARLLAAALAEHARVPHGIDAALAGVHSRDDVLARSAGHTMADMGVYRLRPEIAASRVPIVGWGSWMDSGIAQGMLNRFADLPNQQIGIIGAWIHGARADADPFKPADAPLEPDADTQRRIDLCFAQGVLAGDPSITAAGSRLLYYTMGEGRWKATDRWPVAGMRPVRFHLAAGGGLTRRSPQSGEATYRVDPATTTGPLNRWMTQMGQASAPDIVYGDRREQDRKLLAFHTAPLARDTELTGTPVVRLSLTADRPGGAVFAYLEDVAPDGRVTYVAEGQLDTSRRRLVGRGEHYPTLYPARSYAAADRRAMTPGEPTVLEFQLQPTSVRIRAGHRIRLALAGADRDSFAPVAAPVYRIRLGGREGSSIVLPVVAGARR